MSVHTTRREEASVGAETEQSEGSGTEREPRGRGAHRLPAASKRVVSGTAHRAEVAVLGARVAALETELRERDRRRQHLVERYERLLEAADDAELATDGGWSDGGWSTDGRVDASPGTGGGLRRRLARLFSR
jgi:hypothetical protein